MNTHMLHHRSILQSIAHRAMLERGLLPDFSSEALNELEQIQSSAAKVSKLVPDVPAGNVLVGIDSNTIRDMRNFPWASIDNDDSRDLDQLTVAEAMRQSQDHGCYRGCGLSC